MGIENLWNIEWNNGTTRISIQNAIILSRQEWKEETGDELKQLVDYELMNVKERKYYKRWKRRSSRVNFVKANKLRIKMTKLTAGRKQIIKW